MPDRGGSGLAVVVVKVPLTADRLVALHQKPGLPPHLAVEVLHTELFPTLGPVREIRLARDETVVLQRCDAERKRLQRLDQPPFAWARGDDLRSAMPVRGGEKGGGD